VNKNLILIVVVLAVALLAAAFLLRPKKESQPQPQPVPERPWDVGPQQPEPEPEPEPEPWPAFTQFEGTWHTEKNRTKPELNGRLLCDANYQDGKWKGKFYGDWRGMDFSYPVEWEGSPGAVVGKADVDGVPYDWKGTITEDSFNGSFESHRYIGDFKMKRKQ